MTDICWLALETTGLDPGGDEILEIAAVVTDGQLNELGAIESTIFVPEAEGLCGDFVTKMHTANGLLAEVLDASSGAVPSNIAEARLTSFLAGLGYSMPKSLVLAGNSVYFDLNFLRYDMPRLAELFGHRLLDMSAVALFADAAFGVVRPQASGAHRAMADVRESIAYFRHYAKVLQRSKPHDGGNE